MLTQQEREISLKLRDLLLTAKRTISIAESCTGGYISHLITAISGSSRYFKGSVVAYSNEIKEKILGVDSALIEQHGAVSNKVVRSMVIGIKKLFRSDYAIAISGIAGPTGGTQDKVVGTVWFAYYINNNILTEKHIFKGDRLSIIQQAAQKSISIFIEYIKNLN